MAKRKKDRIRALAAREGISYQAARQGLRNATAFHTWLESVITKARAFAAPYLDGVEAARRERAAGLAQDDLERRFETRAHRLRGKMRARTEENALKAAFDSVPEDYLVRTEAIMWVGRDVWPKRATKKDFVDRYRHSLEMFDATDEGDRRLSVVSYVTSKIPLADYLANGLRAAADVGFDVNADFPSA